ncbi:hypothetical protein E8E13_003428 [Curvularia kusanoi]|uniref:LITAF domain-containing protein n=1 Tax=Curvularia kusanoi TaxID=90978 RepID=A0A9P4TKM9_CURKU|nr:hypothetical protein E8E13_003428 [Curvularia kusanoi]
MEKQGVPMQQYPQSPDHTGASQPPVYQDPAAAQYQQQYPPQQYPQQVQSPVQSPAPHEHQQKAFPAAGAAPGMPPQQPSGPVYQNATPIASLGRGPAPADCPACGQRSMTSTAFETGNTTHAWAAALFCLTCLCCIPYMMNSFKDVTHKCGRCGVLLATWHRSGTTEVHIHS